MHPSSRKNIALRGLLSAALAFALSAAPALALQGGAAAVGKPAAPLTSTEREAIARVKSETVREVVTTLASKDMEGRGTAQPGADRAAQYIADKFAKFGLKPLGEGGTYLQPIKFRVTEVLPESNIKAGDATLKHGEDFVLPPPHTYEQADATGELVFAGFGVASQELKRDDLAGLDLKGKIVVYVNGRPKGVDEAAWRKAANPQVKVMSLFGRGAAAVVVANVSAPGLTFPTLADYLSRRRVSLASETVPPFKVPPVILAGNAGVEKLFAGTGGTYAQAFEKLMAGESASRALGKTATITLRLKIGEGTSSNVAGVLEGSDPKLKEEAVVYTAHYDAYGINSKGVIYPGAADNALGTGMILSIAEALAKSPKRPRRSVIFLAVTGEEYGLLGAEHWVGNPTWPIERVVANINHDSAGTEVYGPVKRVVGWGQEHSDLGAAFEGAVAATGNVVTPDPFPEENAFVRSDHYAFVKKGVPALMLLGAPGGDPAPWIARTKRWMETDYHSPKDVVLPDWDWSGPATVARVGLLIGLRVAEADKAPAWLASSPFNKPRAMNPAPAVKQ